MNVSRWSRKGTPEAKVFLITAHKNHRREEGNMKRQEPAPREYAFEKGTGARGPHWTAAFWCWRHGLRGRKRVLLADSCSLICLSAQETYPLTLYFNGYLSTAPKLYDVAKIFVSRAKHALGLCMISLLRAFRGADLIINHLRLMIIVYVRIVPSSEWLRKGLVNDSWEIFVFTCTQRSTQCIQRHKLQPSVLLTRYFIKSGPLSWNCLYDIHNKRWFSVLIASPYQLGEGVAVAPFPSQPHTWPLTGPAAVVGTKKPTAPPALCCKALHLFIFIAFII